MNGKRRVRGHMRGNAGKQPHHLLIIEQMLPPLISSQIRVSFESVDMTLINPSLSLPPTLATGISPTSAHVLSLLFTSSYVGSMYLSHLFARSRPPPGSSSTSIRMKVSKPPEQIIADNADDDTPVPGSRDYPDTIRSRMKAGSIATAASLGAVWWVVKEAGGYGVIAAADVSCVSDRVLVTDEEQISPTLRLLGIPTRLTLASFLTPNTFLPYLLAPTLLLGPLFATYLDRCLPFQRFSPSTNDIGLIEFRNYLVVRPLSSSSDFDS